MQVGGGARLEGKAGPVNSAGKVWIWTAGNGKPALSLKLGLVFRSSDCASERFEKAHCEAEPGRQVGADARFSSWFGDLHSHCLRLRSTRPTVSRSPGHRDPHRTMLGPDRDFAALVSSSRGWLRTRCQSLAPVSATTTHLTYPGISSVLSFPLQFPVPEFPFLIGIRRLHVILPRARVGAEVAMTTSDSKKPHVGSRSGATG